MGWKVFIDGKYAGIVESNYEWASKYWSARARRSGERIELRQEATSTVLRQALKAI